MTVKRSGTVAACVALVCASFGAGVESIPAFASASASDSVAASIASGSNQSCAVTTAGGVKCWGDNGFGQLGDGTTATDFTAVEVVGLDSGVSAVATNGYTACALTTVGRVKCWGDNVSGELGIGTTEGPEHCGGAPCSKTPVAVHDLGLGVRAIAVGRASVCALTKLRTVKCWGDNFYGDLGNGTTDPSPLPVKVLGLTEPVAAISGSCALTVSGGAKCWGFNGLGDLGDGTTIDRSVPVDVVGLTSGVRAIANHCALLDTRGVKCWGSNAWGQLGNASYPGPAVCGTENTPCSTTPVYVLGLTRGVESIETSDFNACAVTQPGRALCWGMNIMGQLAHGHDLGPEQCDPNRPPACSTKPVAVLGLAQPVTAIDSGLFHTCALALGGVKCFGGNEFGQLGIGTKHGPHRCDEGFFACSWKPLDVIGLNG